MKITALILSFMILAACAEKRVSPENGDAPTESRPKSSFFMTKATATTPVELVFDKKYAGKKLENYRKNTDLRMSGSATFGPKGLREIARPLKKSKTALYVFDLRQESHGLINDEPVTWSSDRDWANADLNHEEATRRERRQLGDLRVGEKLGGAEIKSIETEESMVRSAGYQYVRLTVPDYVRPTDSEVDLFIQAQRDVPEQSWIHFHCRSGKGRTTLFMIMYDMLVSAKYIPFDDIVNRNKSLSNDPTLLTVGDPKDWKYPYQQEMLTFVQQFYNYAKEHPRGEKKLWSEWVHQ